MPGSHKWSPSLSFPHQNPVYASPLTKRATCPTHLLLDFITRKILGEQYRSISSSLRSFLHSPVTSSLLGPNILLSTIFSKNISLLFSVSVSDRVSQPYKTTNSILVLYILIFKFWIAHRRTKYSAPNDNKHSLKVMLQQAIFPSEIQQFRDIHVMRQVPCIIDSSP